MKPTTTSRIGRTLKNLALVCLFSGFALVLGGGVIDDRTLFKTGTWLFLGGIPLLFLGIFYSRRGS